MSHSLRDDEIEDSSGDEASDADLIELIERVRIDRPDFIDDLIPDAMKSPSGAFESFKLTDVDDVPTQIGRFQIVEKLGEGGFGIVFSAVDPRLDRQVAIKIPRAETLLSSEARRRFISEGKTVAKLNHPNIAPVLETGKIGPICYIVSGYCRGGSLAQWLRRRRDHKPDQRDTRIAAKLIESLACAVQHAHELGVLHRDLKPANIVFDTAPDAFDSLEPQDQMVDLGAVARIVDFGLAKLVQEESQFTRTGTMLGTPNYSSPEQHEGTSVGPATDVYSLGAMLYELLTGVPPLQRSSPIETLLAAKNDPPVAPRRINSRCPKDLEAICLKCLEKKPDYRYESAQVLADDLQRFLNREPVLARAPSLARRVGQWCVRYPLVTVLVAGIMSVVIIAPLVAVRQNQLYHAAQESREQADCMAYMSDMNLALHDWEEANLERCRLLLNRHGTPSLSGDFRGFEWYFLNALIRENDRVPIVTQLENPESLALSPDGHTLAIGSYEGVISLVNRATGNMMGQWKAHPYDIRNLQFSADGQTLASVNIDEEAAIWDVKTRECIAELKAHLAIAMSPKGHTIAYCLNNSSLAIRRNEGAETQIIEDAHSHKIWDLAFSPHGQRIATASWDGEVRIWDANSGSLQQVVEASHSLWAVRWSPDGKWLVTGDALGGIRILDGTTGAIVRAFVGHEGAIRDLEISSDSQTLFTAAEDRVINVWELPSGSHLRKLRGHRGPVVGLALADQDRTLLSASYDGDTRSWDLAANDQSANTLAHPSAPTSVSFSADGATLVSTCYDGKIRFWNPASGALMREFDGHDGTSWRAVHLSFMDQPAIATSGSDGTVRFWNSRTGQALHEVPACPDATDPLPLDISSDGTLLAFADSRSSAVVWDVKSKSNVLHSPGGYVNALRISPDNRFLFVAQSRALRAFDIASGHEVFAQSIHSKSISQLALSPFGNHLATASQDRSVMMWDFRPTGKSVLHMRDHLTGPGDIVDGVVFSPDGLILASGGGDRVVRIWDVETGRQRATLSGHSSGIVDLAFSPNGEILASAGYDHSVRLWRAPRMPAHK